MMPSNHLILCHPLLFLPPIPPSIRVFSNELALHIRWPKYWSFSFSISPFSEYSGLISFRTDWFYLLEVQETLKNLHQKDYVDNGNRWEKLCTELEGILKKEREERRKRREGRKEAWKGKERYDKPRQCIAKQRCHFANRGPNSQSCGFSSGHVWIWELDCKESWAPKNWCFWTAVLEKSLVSPLDSKEIKPVNHKGNQHWVFIGKTDAEAETPVLWPVDVKS